MSNENEAVKSEAQFDSKPQQEQQQQEENAPIETIVNPEKANEVLNWQQPDEQSPNSEAHVLLKVKSGLDTNVDADEPDVDETVKKSMESDNEAEGAELKRVEEDISLKVLKDDTKTSLENEEVAKGVSNPLVNKE